MEAAGQIIQAAALVADELITNAVFNAPRDAKGTPVMPELAGFTPASATCIYGTDDRDTICPRLPPEQMTGGPLKGDHHFGGNYDGLAEQILQRSR